LDKFSGIPAECVARLEAVGITNTRQLLSSAKDKQARKQLAKTAECPLETLDELVCLSDLSRVYGVGPAYARMILDVGVESVQEFAALSAEDFIRIYEDATQKKADFGVNEIQFSLELARELPIAVEA
jgi:predicted flap endonuclease-1-like 5' DNA nuclease